MSQCKPNKAPVAASWAKDGGASVRLTQQMELPGGTSATAARTISCSGASSGASW